MSKQLWRKSVTELKSYVPGKAIEEVKKEFGLEEITRLASNENPFGSSPKAVQGMQDALLESHLYPEGSCLELREKLANQHGLEPEEIVVGNGADHIIRLVGAAYIQPGDEVIYCVPTFSAYRSITVLMEGVPIEIPAKDNAFDLEAILTAVNDKTKMIFICNPNNPTGTIVDEVELQAFLNRLPKHVLVVLDEAYIEFVQCEPYRNAIDFILADVPVISIRTFSKLYGLAALRVGYAMGRTEYLLPVKTVREHFAVNRIAQAGAIAALDDHAFVEKTLQENKREMEKLITEFHSLGYEVNRSYTNFLFVDMKQDTTAIFRALMQKGILIRPCGAWNLPTHARITIGTSQQNELLIQILKELSTTMNDVSNK